MANKTPDRITEYTVGYRHANGLQGIIKTTDPIKAYETFEKHQDNGPVKIIMRVWEAVVCQEVSYIDLEKYYYEQADSR